MFSVNFNVVGVVLGYQTVFRQFAAYFARFCTLCLCCEQIKTKKEQFTRSNKDVFYELWCNPELTTGHCNVIVFYACNAAVSIVWTYAVFNSVSKSSNC